MLLPAVLLCVVAFVCGLDPNLWTPYDENVISAIPREFRVLEVSYTLEPFIIYINGYGDTAEGFTPESLENLFSVYHNYTEYNYIERVHALVVHSYDDKSSGVKSDVTLPNDSLAAAFYFNKTDICLPRRVPIEVTDGFSQCGTVKSGSAQGEKCVNGDGNYALYSDSQSAVTGFYFSTGCHNSDNPLHIFLAPDMLGLGTWGRGCSSAQQYDCNTEELITMTCTLNTGGSGYLIPYNCVSAFDGNDQMAEDGTYSVMGYCEKGSDGSCFEPSWFPNA